MILLLQKKLLAQGITGPEGHPWSRPPPVSCSVNMKKKNIILFIKNF